MFSACSQFVPCGTESVTDAGRIFTSMFALGGHLLDHWFGLCVAVAKMENKHVRVSTLENLVRI